MKLIEGISWLKGRLQEELFPSLEECWQSPLTEKEQQLVSILELIQIEKYVRSASNQWLGRKLRERDAVARSFVAKAVYGYPNTRKLIEALKASTSLRRICGFDRPSSIPSESSFSRAFAEFADTNLCLKVHEAMVEGYLKPELVGHVNRDSTEIKGREKPARKAPKEKPAPRKRGCPAKGEERAPKEPKRLERQRDQSADEAIKELPTLCDCGAKKNSKGFIETWIGYKLHADVNDCGLPVSLVLTSASVHDSQVAIPLMKMTSSRVDYLYDVMDSAYDAKLIYEASRDLGHVPIIDKNSRGKEVIPMAPHEASRYKERTAVERFYSRLKEEFGGRNVMVRGAKKVMTHLMFGAVAIFADHLLKLAT